MIRTIQIVKCDLCYQEQQSPSYYTNVKLETMAGEAKLHELGRKNEFHLCPDCTKKLREFIEIPF